MMCDGKFVSRDEVARRFQLSVQPQKQLHYHH